MNELEKKLYERLLNFATVLFKIIQIMFLIVYNLPHIVVGLIIMIYIQL